MSRSYFFLLLSFFSCAETNRPSLHDSEAKVRIPSAFPELVYPADNAPTKLRIELGRRLFYDNRLSQDESLNCGSCHVLSAAFTDGRATSQGLHGSVGKRNAPTLANVAWLKRLLMEGGVPTLETQVLVPLHDSTEMAPGMMPIVDRLNEDEDLRA
jgi:cytochrome c peroxidase